MKKILVAAVVGSQDIDNGGCQTAATPDFHSVRWGVNWRF